MAEAIGLAASVAQLTDATLKVFKSVHSHAHASATFNL